MTAQRPHDPDATVWPALVVAPLLALGHLSIAYALVTPACAAQSGGMLHVLCALSLVVVLVLTGIAWRAWRRAVSVLQAPVRAVTASDGIATTSRASFVALMATVIGAFSALVIAAMWLPVGVVPACTA